MRQEKHNYDKDFYKWAYTQADLLKKRQFDKVDLENIIEEIETLGRSDKRKLSNLLIVLMQHLLKETYSPENKGNSRSWDATIINSRGNLKRLLRDSPSLKPILKQSLKESYDQARELAIVECNIIDEEIYPQTCPWTLKEILGE